MLQGSPHNPPPPPTHTHTHTCTKGTGYLQEENERRDSDFDIGSRDFGDNFSPPDAMNSDEENGKNCCSLMNSLFCHITLQKLGPSYQPNVHVQCMYICTCNATNSLHGSLIMVTASTMLITLFLSSQGPEVRGPRPLILC